MTVFAGCSPDCANRNCGPDSCGGYCGSAGQMGFCPNGWFCNADQTCTCCAVVPLLFLPAGFGGGGACRGALTRSLPPLLSSLFPLCSFPCAAPLCCPCCVARALAGCKPDCSGRECGNDGCGGFCGTPNGQCGDYTEKCVRSQCGTWHVGHVCSLHLWSSWVAVAPLGTGCPPLCFSSPFYVGAVPTSPWPTPGPTDVPKAVACTCARS